MKLSLERQPLTKAQKMFFINLATLSFFFLSCWFGFWGLIYDRAFWSKDFGIVLLMNLSNIMFFVLSTILTALFFTLRTYPELLHRFSFKLERGSRKPTESSKTKGKNPKTRKKEETKEEKPKEEKRLPLF